MSLGRYGDMNFWSQGQRWYFATGLTTAVAILGAAYHLRRRWRPKNRLNPKQMILITGCDSGLGYNLAMHCRDQGGKVFAGVLNTNGPAVRDLTQRGVMVHQLDITDLTSVQAFVKALQVILRDQQLELGALVNNAGVMIFGEFEWQLAEQAKSQIEVNVLGTMSITRQLMPVIRRYSARIVNVTSHCALEPLPGLAIYGATKAALQAWTISLRVELAKYGVKVVSFIPGSFTRESNLLASQKKHFDEMRAAMDDDTRQFYGEYFERYVDYLTSLPVNNGRLRRIENPKLYDAFDGALLDTSPDAVYKCEPWRYTLYHALFRIAPSGTRDWLVERFMQMPVWKSSGTATSDRRSSG